MDIKNLIAVGLTKAQAEAYALFIEHDELRPPEVAEKLGLSRTNAYKLLDKLAEMGLIIRDDTAKKASYKLANPLAISKLAAEFRSLATAREEVANSIMNELLPRYREVASKLSAATYFGTQEVATAYRQQISLKEDIYFIHTTADVPKMGFNTMNEIRTVPASYGKHRQAIMFTKGNEKQLINTEAHKRSNLQVTLAPVTSYSSPVEWSVTKSSLLIVSYATEPQAILIQDETIAGAFVQLWQIIKQINK